MKYYLLIIMLITGQMTFGQSNSFTLSGKIKGLDATKIFLVIFDDAFKSGYRRDSIKVENKAFFYTATADKIMYASISPNVDRVVKKAPGGGYYPAKSSSIQLFVFPGANIKLTGKITDFVDAYPSGDNINNDFAKLNKSIYPLMNQSVNVAVKISNKLVTDSTIIKKMKDTAVLLDKQVIGIKENFINDHRSSVAAIWLLSDMMIRSQLSNSLATEFFGKMNKEKLVDVSFYADAAKRVDGFTLTAAGKNGSGYKFYEYLHWKEV